MRTNFAGNFLNCAKAPWAWERVPERAQNNSRRLLELQVEGCYILDFRSLTFWSARTACNSAVSAWPWRWIVDLYYSYWYRNPDEQTTTLLAAQAYSTGILKFWPSFCGRIKISGTGFLQSTARDRQLWNLSLDKPKSPTSACWPAVMDPMDVDSNPPVEEEEELSEDDEEEVGFSLKRA